MERHFSASEPGIGKCCGEDLSPGFEQSHDVANGRLIQVESLRMGCQSIGAEADGLLGAAANAGHS
jgi:hypothetical protein